nr:immunoglobulin light chain junction region [Macaca mulatta]MOW40151.1 immunoglobulin light chain junction region [Macaca mulatta]MOW40529.1 immunoglobulin light chain junction region [Macaca mulatta]
CQHGYGTPLTF